jgi:hypothetical protein
MTSATKKEFSVLSFKAYKRKECRRRIIVSIKVAITEHPPPKYVRVHIKFKDGSETVARAHIVSAYYNYAYYFLDSANAKEVAPRIKKVQEMRVYKEEETQ